MNNDTFARLCAPLDPAAVSWRVGTTSKDKNKGLALAYIDARDVMKRLDDVVGPANWQRRYSHADKKTICEIAIRALCFFTEAPPDQWVVKADGAGDSDIEAEKGAISDAFKRAAVNWGIGRYLYELESPWVALDTYEAGGKVVVRGIQKSEFPKLEKLLGGKFKAEPEEPASKLVPAKPALTAEQKEQAAVSWLDTFGKTIDAGMTAEQTSTFINENLSALRKAGAYPALASRVADYLSVIGEAL